MPERGGLQISPEYVSNLPAIMRYMRPVNLLAGFEALQPDAGVPELAHAGEQWATTRHFIPTHEHVIWELYLQLDGVSEWISGRTTYVLRPGGFFAAPPRIVHSMKEYPKATHHFMYAGIDLDRVFDRYPDLRPLWDPRRCVHLPRGESLEQPFRQLIREVWLNLPLRSEGLRAATDYVVIEASRLFRRQGARPILPVHPAVEKVRDVLDHHYAQPWRLADLGRLANVSPNHLVQIFTKEIGLSPHQYLLRQRVERAKELLRHSDLSVTQIAGELGFSSSQHFAKIFRQITRRTAMKFRQKSRHR
jgi:AraC-like DNA-binding protein